jgi:tripartite-type tricarboxylate transporter receptor subunit TctC
VPSVGESGLLPGFESAPWYGIARAGWHNQTIVTQRYAEIAKIIKTPEVANRYMADGVFEVGNRPENFAERIRNESGRWARIMKTAGMKQASF